MKLAGEVIFNINITRSQMSFNQNLSCQLTNGMTNRKTWMKIIIHY